MYFGLIHSVCALVVAQANPHENAPRRLETLTDKSYGGIGAPFQEPTKIHSAFGVLDVTLSLTAATYVGPTATFTTRVLGGSLPGPTLLINPGERLKILFRNDAPASTGTAKWKMVRNILYGVGAGTLMCGIFGGGGLMYYQYKKDCAKTNLRKWLCLLGPVVGFLAGVGMVSAGGMHSGHNKLQLPDESNLHFHGAFVTPHPPSDDVTVAVSAGSTYRYDLEFPPEHMPGTLWIHPHHHGSTAVHVGGGAACTLIIKDLSGSLPSELEQIPDKVWLVQRFNDEVSDMADSMGDTVYSSSSSSSFWLVNGLSEPVLTMKVGEWQRWRFVHAGWTKDSLDISIPNCELKLLAKDSIYIRDFPRTIVTTAIPAGGRADVVVRCLADGMHDVLASGSVLARASVSPSISSSALTLRMWTPSYPSYLRDLRMEVVPGDCDCPTKVTGKSVNGHAFDFAQRIHEAKLGSVMQRVIEAGTHPYHQHIFPFQLVSIGETDFMKIGDWQDTLPGSFTMRFNPLNFTGKMMLHCHILEHEDQGAMGIEQINDPSGKCMCGSKGIFGLNYIILCSVLGTLCCSYLCCGFAGSCAKDKWKHNAAAQLTPSAPKPTQVGHDAQ